MDTNKHESKFWRRVFLVTLFAFVVLAVIGVAKIASPSQPQYEGKSLDYWCEKLLTDYPTNESAVLAVRAIGSNAIPHLIQQLREADTKYNTIRGANSLLDRQIFVEAQIQQGMHKWQKACWGFRALGSMASNAIPELESLLSGNPQIIHALLMIGDSAMPVLLQTQTNLQFWADNHVAAGISAIASYGGFTSSNLILFLPSLRALSQSTNQLTAMEAKATLRHLSDMIGPAGELFQKTVMTNGNNP